MKAAEMKERPAFSLMKQTDVQNIYHMQMPRWLFSDPRYAGMSLDAKVTYTFLLNRFQLSRRNGWANSFGEVFVIFPRRELARELRIGEKRVTAAFQKLSELNLIWEKRCGRGDANQIYLASVQPVDDSAYSCAPFISERQDHDVSRTADVTGLVYGAAGTEPQESSLQPFQNRPNGGLRTGETAVAEPSNLRPSYNNTSKKEKSDMEVSRFVSHGQADDEAELMGILDACELSFFDPETASVFENAIERLFFSDSFRIGTAVLPQSRVRSRLHLLDGMILRNAESKLHANLDRPVRNSTAYTMATIFNCIAESESDLMVDPYLNSLRSPPDRR